MTEKLLNICLLGLLVWALWRRISPAVRLEIDRTMKIASIVLLMAAVSALFLHIY
ncbi:protein MIGRI [Janthinobacterium sp. B9-8]|uniref:protein MIGRI n=1 Tax=Janthinobacterium sp. B9-8 TaxID=1236179 RepID=UPI000B0A3BDC